MTRRKLPHQRSHDSPAPPIRFPTADSRFKKNKTQAKRTTTAKDALIYLWDYLGWTGSKRPVALGLIGPLHSEFAAYRNIAQRLCRRFDARFPFANL